MLGGGGLFAVFPLAYAVIMPALYPPIIAMLLALVFRGVAFEFRFRAASASGRIWWDRRVLLAARSSRRCAKALTLGGLLQGIHVEDRAYAGRLVRLADAASPCCAGCALVLGYALQGACWLIWRTEGGLQRRARRYAARSGGRSLHCHRRRQPVDADAEPDLPPALVHLARHPA